MGDWRFVLIRLCALATCLAATPTRYVALRKIGLQGPSEARIAAIPLRDLQGLIIARVRDCNSRLEFTHVFERPALERVRLRVIVLLDARDDAVLTRARRVFAGLNFQRPNRYHTRLFAAVRAAPTPILFLLTPDGMLRMALEAPMTPQEADRLTSWLVSPADK